MVDLIALLIRLISEALESQPARRPRMKDSDEEIPDVTGKLTEWDRRYRERSMRTAVYRERTEGPRDFRSALEELQRRRAGRTEPPPAPAAIAGRSAEPPGTAAINEPLEKTPQAWAEPISQPDAGGVGPPEVQTVIFEQPIPAVPASEQRRQATEKSKRRRKRERDAAATVSPPTAAKAAPKAADRVPDARGNSAASFVCTMLSSPSSARRAIILAEVLGRRGGMAMRGRAF